MATVGRYVYNEAETIRASRWVYYAQSAVDPKQYIFLLKNVNERVGRHWGSIEGDPNTQWRLMVPTAKAKKWIEILEAIPLRSEESADIARAILNEGQAHCLGKLTEKFHNPLNDLKARRTYVKHGKNSTVQN